MTSTSIAIVLAEITFSFFFVCRNKLPDEIRRQLILKLGMLMRRPEQTKICYKQLHKAALHGTLHSWAESLVFTTADEDIALPEELAEVILFCRLVAVSYVYRDHIGTYTEPSSFLSSVLPLNNEIL